MSNCLLFSCFVLVSIRCHIYHICTTSNLVVLRVHKSSFYNKNVNVLYHNDLDLQRNQRGMNLIYKKIKKEAERWDCTCPRARPCTGPQIDLVERRVWAPRWCPAKVNPQTPKSTFYIRADLRSIRRRNQIAFGPRTTEAIQPLTDLGFVWWCTLHV